MPTLTDDDVEIPERFTRAVEQVTSLRRMGLSSDQIVEDLGLKRETLVRYLEGARRNDLAKAFHHAGKFTPGTCVDCLGPCGRNATRCMTDFRRLRLETGRYR